MGIGPSPPMTERAGKRYEKMVGLVRRGKIGRKDGGWKAADLESLWNFEVPYRRVVLPDTVAAVAKDRSGRFAVASSTGGASPMMLGRVGDTAIVGSGFYAGPVAAIAATGIGEEIVRRMLAKAVYDLIHEGKGAQEACEQGIAMFPDAVSAGLIAITSSAHAIAANRRMAAYSITKEI